MAAVTIENDARRSLVVETLRFLASGWVGNHEGGEDDQKWLRETADEIEQSGPEDWICCPLCAEVICDEGCPLAAFGRNR